MKIPKITTTDLLFVVGGVAIGYFLVPKIFHHDALDSLPPDLAPDFTTEAPSPEFQFIPQAQPQIITVPVPVSLPTISIGKAMKNGSNTDQFGANVENKIRNSCPNGSIGPDSSVCRANILKFYHDVVSAWGVSNSSTKHSLENAVASSTNCCCTPKNIPCQYSAHLRGNQTAEVIQQ